MRHANVDGLLEDLREELSIEPSPDFEYRVRDRVLGTSRWSAAPMVRRVDRTVVGLICASTLAAVMGTLSATSWVRETSTVVPSVATITQADVATRTIPIPTEPISNPVATAGIVATGVSETRYQVLVPPDQAIALRRLLAAMAKGRSVVPAGVTMTDAETGELQEPDLIGITRLPEIVPLDVREVERGRERR